MTLPNMRAAFDAGVFDDLPVAVLYLRGSSLIDANREWSAISQLGRAESAGAGWLRAIHPHDRIGASACLTSAPTGPDLDLTARIISGDGSANWFRGHLRVVDDPLDRARLLTLTAVADRSNEARLLYLSSHDELTGLVNRRGFLDSVQRTLGASTEPAGMLFIDLDRFKAVNDQLGHRAGDVVLQTVSRRIASAIRSSDIAGRLGGDEIGVFCPGAAAADELFSLAERIGAALATPFKIDDQIVAIDASIGISFRTDSCRTAASLIDAADRAMYIVKTAGGGTWATLDGSPSTINQGTRV